MNNKINIKNALISVFDKEGLEDIVYRLNASELTFSQQEEQKIS